LSLGIDGTAGHIGKRPCPQDSAFTLQVKMAWLACVANLQDVDAAKLHRQKKPQREQYGPNGRFI